MKKIILSTIVAAAVASTANAGMKLGLGNDVINGQNMLRISIDGLAEGVRVEPRVAFASMTPEGGDAVSMSAYGVGAYYNLSKTVSVGGMFDSYDMTEMGGAEGTDMAVVVKAEADLGENFSIAYEVGLQSNSVTDTSVTTQPYSAVTMRAWF